MKIYCNKRRNVSDEDFMQSIVGKDIWVQVYTHGAVGINESLPFIQLVQYDPDNNFYIVRYVPREYIFEPNDVIEGSKDRIIGAYLNKTTPVRFGKLEPVRPFNCLTTEEIKERLELNLNEISLNINDWLN